MSEVINFKESQKKVEEHAQQQRARAFPTGGRKNMPNCKESRNTLAVKHDAGAREVAPGVPGPDSFNSGLPRQERDREMVVRGWY